MSINIELMEMCERLRAEIAQAEQIVLGVYKPILTDTSKLQEIHDILAPLVKETERSYGKRAEIFVMLYLYSPDRIFRTYDKNDKHNGVCAKIAKVMGVHKANISNYCNTLLFFYKTYVAFRQVVENYLKAITKTMKI